MIVRDVVLFFGRSEIFHRSPLGLLHSGLHEAQSVSAAIHTEHVTTVPVPLFCPSTVYIQGTQNTSNSFSISKQEEIHTLPSSLIVTYLCQCTDFIVT